MTMRVLRRRAPAPTPGAGRLPDLESWSVGAGRVHIGVPVHDGVTTADIERPTTVLADALEGRVQLLGRDEGPVVGIEPSRRVIASARRADVWTPDIVVVPGGVGWQAQAADQQYLDWLRRACRMARGVLCVSTGSLLLAAAGVLRGEKAAGHWLALQRLDELGAVPVADRVHTSDDGRIVTAAGALAATTAAAELAARLAG